jgi:hypothetical protein
MPFCMVHGAPLLGDVRGAPLHRDARAVRSERPGRPLPRPGSQLSDADAPASTGPLPAAQAAQPKPAPSPQSSGPFPKLWSFHGITLDPRSRPVAGRAFWWLEKEGRLLRQRVTYERLRTCSTTSLARD